MIDKLDKLIQQGLKLTVLGSGYVGLPTAALFANTGFRVLAVDIKPEIVQALNCGVSPLNEPGLDELVSRSVKSGRLQATLNSFEAITQADAVIISVQTPIDRNKKPNLTFLMNALENVGKNLKKEMLIAICSTVPPGTIQKKVKPLLESLSGLQADIDFYLAYVPERIAPGKALKEFVESPRLVGGIGTNSTKRAAELFKTVCKTVIETDAATAEITKLAENIYRDINIAFANELALICEQHGVDAKEAIKLANTHPRVKIHTPGPGVGGPCLTKDPYLLTYKINLKTQNIVKTARKINDYMPKHIVTLTLQALQNTGKEIKNSKIAILGTAYKANVADSRNSSSQIIIKKFIRIGIEIIVYDPYCDESFGAKKGASFEETIKGVDSIIILTDHNEFENFNLPLIKKLMNRNPIIIDGRRIVNPNEAEQLGFYYYGIGYNKHLY